MFFILHSNVLINFNDQLKHVWRKYDSDLISGSELKLCHRPPYCFYMIFIIIHLETKVCEPQASMTTSHLTSQDAVFVLSYLPG